MSHEGGFLASLQLGTRLGRGAFLRAAAAVLRGGGGMAAVLRGGGKAVAAAAAAAEPEHRAHLAAGPGDADEQEPSVERAVRRLL